MFCIPLSHMTVAGSDHDADPSHQKHKQPPVSQCRSLVLAWPAGLHRWYRLICLIAALKEGTHSTKTFLTLHQDETTSEAMRHAAGSSACWEQPVCLYIINKGAAAPWHVGFTVRVFIPNFNNLRGRYSQPCPNDLEMKRSSEHMSTTVGVPGEPCTDGVCAWCRAVLSRGSSRHGQCTAGRCTGSGQQDAKVAAKWSGLDLKTLQSPSYMTHTWPAAPVGILDFTWLFFMPVFLWLKYCEFCFQTQLEALASTWSSRKCFNFFCYHGTERKYLPRLLRKKLSHIFMMPPRTWT